MKKSQKEKTSKRKTSVAPVQKIPIRVLYKKVGQVPKVKIIYNVTKLKRAIVKQNLKIIPYENLYIICKNPKQIQDMRTNAGTYADPVNANHVLKRICKNLDIKNVTSHTLRHTFATRCIEAGMRAVALKELMGHSNVSITLNVYASVFNKFKKSELEKVNNYYIRHLIMDRSPLMLILKTKDNKKLGNENCQQKNC